jgi:hypothetical protein
MIKMGEPDTEGNNEYCADYHKLQTLSPENHRKYWISFHPNPPSLRGRGNKSRQNGNLTLFPLAGEGGGEGEIG